MKQQATQATASIEGRGITLSPENKDLTKIRKRKRVN